MLVPCSHREKPNDGMPSFPARLRETSTYMKDNNSISLGLKNAFSPIPRQLRVT